MNSNIDNLLRLNTPARGKYSLYNSLDVAVTELHKKVSVSQPIFPLPQFFIFLQQLGYSQTAVGHSLIFEELFEGE